MNRGSDYHAQVITDLKLELKRAQDELKTIKLALTLACPFVIATTGYTILAIFRSAI